MTPREAPDFAPADMARLGQRGDVVAVELWFDSSDEPFGAWYFCGVYASGEHTRHSQPHLAAEDSDGARKSAQAKARTDARGTYGNASKKLTVIDI